MFFFFADPRCPVRCKACLCFRWRAGIAGSNLAGGTDVFPLRVLVCCQVEVSATGRSLVQWSPTGPLCESLNAIRCKSHLLQLHWVEECQNGTYFPFSPRYFLCMRLEQTWTNRHKQFSVRVQNLKRCVDGRINRLSSRRNTKGVFISFHLSFRPDRL